MKIPDAAARRAGELRASRRTRSGLRMRPWREIADILELEGHGSFAPDALADAVAGLPLEEHPLAATSPELWRAHEASWRRGFDEEFPGEPWPGLAEARRRIREKHTR